MRGRQSSKVLNYSSCAAMETELLLAPITALEIVGEYLAAGRCHGHYSMDQNPLMDHPEAFVNNMLNTSNNKPWP